MGTLSPSHKPDYSKTEPAVPIPPQPSWYDPSKIVSFDPWGHLVPQVFKHEVEDLGLDVRPSIAVTRAHMKLSEIDESARKGDLKVDGKVLLKSRPMLNPDGTESSADPGVEISISKAAVEPVWYLPGVADRFGMYVVVSSVFRGTDMRESSEAQRIFFDELFSKTQEECIPSLLLVQISRFSFLRLETSQFTSVSFYLFYPVLTLMRAPTLQLVILHTYRMSRRS